MLEPVAGGLSPAPPWPSGLLQPPPVPARDPIEQVLEGPFPPRVLGRGMAGDVAWTVSGLGAATAWTAVAEWRPEDPDEDGVEAPVDDLRARAVAAVLGEGGVEALELEPAWRIAGVVEVHGLLWLGLLDDPLPRSGAARVGDCVIGRGVGSGPGHIAWQVTAGYRGTKDRPVAEQRLRVLAEGWRERAPAPAAYGAEALRWGEGARSATRRAAALEAVCAEAELACGWAVAGGPWPGEEPDLVRIGARLDALRVGLRQDLEALDRLATPLGSSATRLLGEGTAVEPGGPCPEASSDGAALVDRLRGLERTAARWAEALASSRAVTG